LFDRSLYPNYKTYIGPGASAETIQTVGADITLTPDSLTVTGKDPSKYVIFKETLGTFTLPKSLTINGGGVIAKTDIASWDMTGNEKKSITVTGGGRLTTERRFFTAAYNPSAPVNALSGITVTGANSRIILSPMADFTDTTAGPLVLDNGATGTFNRSGAVTAIAGTLLPTGVTAKNGATVEYVGAASYALGADPMAYSGYNVTFDKAPTGLTTIDFTNAKLTTPSFALGGNVTLTNSTIDFTSGIVTGGNHNFVLINSTANIISMTSEASGTAPVFASLAMGSTLHIKDTLTFIKAGAAITPAITLHDANSNITGVDKAKIVTAMFTGN
jgi:hypothetical protein